MTIQNLDSWHKTTGQDVAVFRSSVLPLSETFICDQVKAMTRWRPVLIGETLLDDCPPLDEIALRTIYRDSRAGRLLRRLDRVVEWMFGHSWRKRALVRAVQADLLHIHFATEAVGLWPSISSLGLPVVVTLHGYDINTHADWWRHGSGGRFMRDYPERLLSMAAESRVYFVAVSQAIRRAAIAYGLPPERISVLKIGIDTSLFPVAEPPPSARRPEILFVGRLVEKKGAVYLIEAAARLRERIPDLTLKFLGDGPERPALARRAAELQVSAHFVGAKPHSEVRRLLGQVRMLCLPSVTASNGDAEGFGMVVLEAQAAGVPVITSARGGRDEGMIDGVTGLAFEEGDVDGLTTAIHALMSDPERIDAMGKNGAEFVRRELDIGKCTELLEDFYDSVIRRSGVPGRME
jgi:glycosyltransferase involved in cell wall biosynthesis